MTKIGPRARNLGSFYWRELLAISILKTSKTFLEPAWHFENIVRAMKQYTAIDYPMTHNLNIYLIKIMTSFLISNGTENRINKTRTLQKIVTYCLFPCTLC